MSNPSILVADREDVQRQLIDMLLTVENYEIVPVASGREAMQHLREHTPDLAILDLELPDIGGADLCEKMKSIPRLAGVPVVLIAPGGSEMNLGLTARTRELARIVHADLLLQRPLGDKNLRERVRQLLAESSAEPAAASATVPEQNVPEQNVPEQNVLEQTAPVEGKLEAEAPVGPVLDEADAAAAVQRKLRRENEKLGTRLADLEAANRKLRAALAEKESRLATLQEMHGATLGKIVTLSGRVRELESLATNPPEGDLEQIKADQAREIESLSKRNRLLIQVIEQEKNRQQLPHGRFLRNGQ